MLMKHAVAYFKVLNVQSNLSFQYRPYIFQLSKMCLHPWFPNQVDFLLETSPSVSVHLVWVIKSFILTNLLPLWISFFTDSTSKLLSSLLGSWSSHSTSAEEYSCRLGKEKIQNMPKALLRATSQKMVSKVLTGSGRWIGGMTSTIFGVYKQIASHPAFLWKAPQPCFILHDPDPQCLPGPG